MKASVKKKKTNKQVPFEMNIWQNISDIGKHAFSLFKSKNWWDSWWKIKLASVKYLKVYTKAGSKCNDVTEIVLSLLDRVSIYQTGLI